MTERFLLLFTFTLSSLPLYSQQQQKEAFTCHCPMMNNGDKGKFYISYGYNLDWFTKSDIHFKNKITDDYDFTLYDVRAEDRPGLRNMFHQDITIPQYSYRFGYFFGNRGQWAVEINYDHVKYVMLNDVRVHLKGEIRGTYFDSDTLLVEKFIRYEHTNGANYLMINGVARKDLFHSKSELHWLSGIVKFGAGIVLPRSATYIMGKTRDDTYQVAGYVIGIDLGLRYDFLKHFYFETSGKGAFANYTKVLLPGEGKASQHWFSLEYIFTIGFQFNGKLF